MKSPYILPAITALVGFSIAWVAKPSGLPLPSTSSNTEQPAAAVGRPVRAGSGKQTAATDSNRPKEVNPSDFPLADQAELGPKTRDEARMLRLTEALGLSVDQQGSIISLIEEIQAKADGNVSVIEDLSVRGKAVEEGLEKLLTAEQMVKFQEVRARERDNRIEQRALRMLEPALADVNDLSPTQREEVLSRLRQKSRTEMQSIPAAASLLFDKSILPTNKKELSVDGVLLLARMDQPASTDNPAEIHQKVMNSHRQELEEILFCFDGILTAGQMGQYQAAYYEQQEIMKRLPTQRPDVDEMPVVPAAGAVIDGGAPSE